jgi:small-conductance mechanosensitive channel
MADMMTTLDTILHYSLFEINQTPVTLSSMLMFVIIFILFFIVSRTIEKLLFRKILSHMQVEKSTVFTLSRISHYLIMITGTVVAFQFIGIDLSGLAVIFGLLSVGIGFGLQNVTRQTGTPGYQYWGILQF